VRSAVEASSAKRAASRPGTAARRVMSIPEISAPAALVESVTSALTSMLSAVMPSWPSTPDRFIARQAECAAAISSSGLVLPSGDSNRLGNVTSN